MLRQQAAHPAGAVVPGVVEVKDKAAETQGQWSTSARFCIAHAIQRSRVAVLKACPHMYTRCRSRTGWWTRCWLASRSATGAASNSSHSLHPIHAFGAPMIFQSDKWATGAIRIAPVHNCSDGPVTCAVCMVLWQINSACVAGVHAPVKPVCGRHAAGAVVS